MANKTSKSPDSFDVSIFLHSSDNLSRSFVVASVTCLNTGLYSNAPIPESPTIDSLANALISSGTSPIFLSILSTNSFPQPSGSESANIPKTPSKGSLLDIFSPVSKGSEKGFKEKPVFSHSGKYSNAVRYFSKGAMIPTGLPS